MARVEEAVEPRLVAFVILGGEITSSVAGNAVLAINSSCRKSGKRVPAFRLALSGNSASIKRPEKVVVVIRIRL